MPDPINWTDRGISWERIPVGKEAGPHATDLVEIGHVWSPRTLGTKEGHDALVGHFGYPRVAGWLNGSSSFDVRARAWFKARHNKSRDNVRMSDDDMKLAVYNSVLMSAGGRSRIVERETKVTIMAFTRVIRGGETVTYTDLFGAALAANIDAMPEAPVAMIRAFVAKSLETAGFVPDEVEEDSPEA